MGLARRQGFQAWYDLLTPRQLCYGFVHEPQSPQPPQPPQSSQSSQCQSATIAKEAWQC
jgi:hypothetical protein